ncbi:probable lipid phosphate phosphatase beta [Neltuma alba]|uniref:probable lipid phosphate phosphatase beta n=1 Tax=Neltuma alba TaxID=207710 RepID=UPI0010A4AAE6|nr:probable lipid phosphate phosphatase beta [Prosopis alba]XP_028762694.1 probable lipid phosphate phosphatase beta [Prosopis alba]
MGHEPPKSAASSFLRPLIALDATISLSLHTLTRPIAPRSILLLLEFFADFRFTFPVLLSLFFVTPPSSPLRSHLLLPLLFCSLIDLLFIAAVKFLVRRSRPVYGNHGEYNAVVSVDHFSFPSGHSSRAFFVASLFYFSRLPILDSVPDLKSRAHPSVTALIHRWIGQDDIAAVNLFLFLVWMWALATAFSRITLGRHYVLDIFVGACLGVLEALFTLRFLVFQLWS